jgi:hypothetical protein
MSETQELLAYWSNSYELVRYPLNNPVQDLDFDFELAAILQIEMDVAESQLCALTGCAAASSTPIYGFDQYIKGIDGSGVPPELAGWEPPMEDTEFLDNIFVPMPLDNPDTATDLAETMDQVLYSPSDPVQVLL